MRKMEKKDNSSAQLSLPLTGISRFVFTVIITFIFTAIFALIATLGIPFLLEVLSKFHLYISYLFGLVVLIVFINTFGAVPFIFRGVGLPGSSEYFALMLSVVGILCFLLAIPALIIYWTINPENYKKAIQIGVFLVSTGLSSIFYLTHKKSFGNVTDTVSFFAGTCLGPPTIIEFLL